MLSVIMLTSYLNLDSTATVAIQYIHYGMLPGNAIVDVSALDLLASVLRRYSTAEGRQTHKRLPWN